MLSDKPEQDRIDIPDRARNVRMRQFLHQRLLLLRLGGVIIGNDRVGSPDVECLAPAWYRISAEIFAYFRHEKFILGVAINVEIFSHGVEVAEIRAVLLSFRLRRFIGDPGRQSIEV